MNAQGVNCCGFAADVPIAGADHIGDIATRTVVALWVRSTVAIVDGPRVRSTG